MSDFKYDNNKAILSFHAGAGGVDAQDWTSMLVRMYHKLAQRKGWRFSVLDQSFGEQNGTKNAVCEIIAPGVYPTLKGESGVHRLVRISPYSAKNLRHTSFALVEVLPELKDVDIKVNPQDLKIDTFRSSGPGGQNVNKLDTAVRITHVPTNMVVAVQSERSQQQNKEKAMNLLMTRLAQRMEKDRIKELAQLKPELKSGSIEWGSQIRSYVLHPYQMVKDHRTGIKSSQPEKVLEGDLDKFIEAEGKANN